MPRPAACRSVFAAPTALMLALIHLSTASEPYPTQWRVRSSGLVRWDLAEFRLYSDAACRTEIPVLDNIASGRVHGDENPIARQHYFNDKVFDFDVMSYWAGVPDACGNTWVGGIIGGDEPVRCAMLHQSGWLNYATSVALEAWDDGRQAWIGVGGASELTHCPEGMAMCCFGLQGCPYVDAIAVAHRSRQPLPLALADGLLVARLGCLSAHDGAAGRGEESGYPGTIRLAIAAGLYLMFRPFVAHLRDCGSCGPNLFRKGLRVALGCEFG